MGDKIISHKPALNSLSHDFVVNDFVKNIRES